MARKLGYCTVYIPGVAKVKTSDIPGAWSFCRTKGRLSWVGHSRNSGWIRMLDHWSGHQSNTPVNNFAPQSFYIILYPTQAPTFSSSQNSGSDQPS